MDLLIKVPQYNGDVFSFDGYFNSQFRHGILEEEMNEPRISIAIWGKKKPDSRHYLANNIRGGEVIDIPNKDFYEIFKK